MPHLRHLVWFSLFEDAHLKRTLGLYGFTRHRELKKNSQWTKFAIIKGTANVKANKFHVSHDGRKSDFSACELQRRRPACAYPQSDQPVIRSLKSIIA